MAGRVETQLKKLGIALPEPPAAAARYVPFIVTGNLVFVAGQLPMQGGKIAVAGRLGDGISIEDGAHAARLCAVNLLAQLKAACGGDLDRVTRCVRLNGFVASASDFTQQPQVVNGASDLIVDALGEAGRHSRVAVGVASLPLGAAVEVDGVFEIS